MKTSKIQKLKDKFYIKDGKVNIYSFGVFNRGLLPSEVKEYVAVRANSLNIKKALKKLEDLSRGSTCPCQDFNGKQYFLYYRHDIEHYCDVIFNKAIFVMD